MSITAALCKMKAARSATLSCTLTLVVTGILISMSALTITTHFVPQIAAASAPSSSSSVLSNSSSAGAATAAEGRPLIQQNIVGTAAPAEEQRAHIKLLYSHLAVGSSGRHFQAEVKLSYLAVMGRNAAVAPDFVMPTVGRCMSAAHAFAILSTICGGVATVLTLMSLLSPPMKGMDIARLALMGTAALSSVLAVALVASASRSPRLYVLQSSLNESDTLSCRLSVGFLLACICAAGFLCATCVELTWFVCFRCSCCASPRDAWPTCPSSPLPSLSEGKALPYDGMFSSQSKGEMEQTV